MKIRRNHDLGLEEARNRIDHMAEQLGKQYSMTSSWNGDHVVVRGNGVNGRIVVAQEYVEAHIQLGIPLAIMQSQIREGIEAVIDEHFGNSSK